MKASKKSVKKLVVLVMYGRAPKNASWSKSPKFRIESRAKAQGRTESLNTDPVVEAEEQRGRLQKRRQRHQARLPKSGMIRRRA